MSRTENTESSFAQRMAARSIEAMENQIAAQNQELLSESWLQDTVAMTPVELKEETVSVLTLDEAKVQLEQIRNSEG